MIFILILVVFSIGGLLIASANMNQTADAWKRVGDVRGKTRAEIEAVVGPPNAVSAMSDGQLCQWMRTSRAGGFHIALLFRDGVCLGITHLSRT